MTGGLSLEVKSQVPDFHCFKRSLVQVHYEGTTLFYYMKHLCM